MPTKKFFLMNVLGLLFALNFGCGLIKPRYVDYSDSNESPEKTNDKVKNCAEGIAAFKQYLSSVVNIKNCSCHATTPPLLNDLSESNRIAFLEVKRSSDYSFLTSDTHPGKDFFKKLSENDFNAWRNIETSKCVGALH